MLFYQVLLPTLLACVAGAQPNGLYPLAEDCTKYRNITSGHTQVSKCASTGGYNFMWSSSSKQCVPTSFPNCGSMQKYCSALPSSKWLRFQAAEEEEADELIHALEEASPVEREESYVRDKSFQCPENEGVFPAKGESHSFRICVDGSAYVGHCEKGEIFDSTSKTCVAEKHGDGAGEYDCHENYDGIFGFSEDCRSYQVCCGGVETMHKCPLGTRFDIVSKSCLLPFRARCEPQE